MSSLLSSTILLIDPIRNRSGERGILKGMSSQPEFLTSKILNDVGVVHGWFMRYGGVSDGLFKSLNGKKGSGDTSKNVDENRSRALTALLHPEFVSESHEGAGRVLIQVQDETHRLVHIIHEFKSNVLNAQRSGEFSGYDASISANKDHVLSQTTADCGTVIIADTSGDVVSLVHGSWHTLSASIISGVVAELRRITSNALVAAIGPMICKSCYEFGPEATELFDAKYLEARAGKYLVDLKQMILDQLAASGVDIVDDLAICTLEDERFFSHRRSGAQSGRFLTLVACTE